MRRTLGRPYPPEIQSRISNLGRLLDDFMASTPAYNAATGQDIAPRIRALNAKLVNDVIIVSDEISDEEASARLGRISDEVFELTKLFKAARVPIGPAPAVSTVEEVATIPRKQAEEMLEGFKKAFAVFPEVIDRYAAVRSSAEAAVALPVGGQAASELLATADRAISEADRGILDAQDLYGRLEKEILPSAGESVSIARPAFDLMRNWVAAVERADEAVKRLEGLVHKKPAEPVSTEPTGIPWWLYAAGVGLILVGVGTLFLDWD